MIEDLSLTTERFLEIVPPVVLLLTKATEIVPPKAGSLEI
jgi:hypothetical protein